jgi:hypothetical protein
MHNAIHCVAFTDWNLYKSIYKQIPYVESILLSDWSAVIEYNVTDRVVLKDDQYHEVSLYLMQGSILCEDYLAKYSNICGILSSGVRTGYDNDNSNLNRNCCCRIDSELLDQSRISTVENVIDKECVLSCESSITENIDIDIDIDNQSLSIESTEIERTEELNSVDYFQLVKVNDGGSKLVNPLKSFLSSPVIEQSNSVVTNECPSIIKTVENSNVNDFDSRSDWRVIDYISEGCGRSDFLTALALSNQITCARNWAENTRLRRIKLDLRRLRKMREDFVEKYNFSSVKVLTFDKVQERLNIDKKVLILLDQELGILDCSVRSLKGRSMSDLCVLIVCSNGVWYPASRRVIKMVMKVVNISEKKHVYNC